MTLLAILVALWVGHYWYRVSQWRRFGWLARWANWVDKQLGPDPRWSGGAGALIMIAVPIVVAVVIWNLAVAWLWTPLVFVLGTAALLYAWGPRDLDRDAAAFSEANSLAQKRRLVRRLSITPGDGDGEHLATSAAHGVFESAVSRWFGVLFWFVVLGPVGALLYRFTRCLGQDMPSSIRQRQVLWFKRLAWLLEWPVRQLLALALALAGDFDTGWQALREYWNRANWYGNHGQILLVEAAGPLGSEPVQAAVNRIWRALFVWLTAIALLTLLGWVG